MARGDYLGQTGKHGGTILKVIPLTNIAVAQDKCFHAGTIELTCAGNKEEASGTFDGLFLRFLNNITAAITPELTCYIFNRDLDTPPVAGDDLVMSVDDYAGLVDIFDVPIATVIPGAAPNTYRSIASVINISKRYQVSDTDTSLYLVFLNKNASSVTPATSSTMDVEAKLLID